MKITLAWFHASLCCKMQWINRFCRLLLQFVMFSLVLCCYSVLLCYVMQCYVELCYVVLCYKWHVVANSNTSIRHAFEIYVVFLYRRLLYMINWFYYEVQCYWYFEHCRLVNLKISQYSTFLQTIVPDWIKRYGIPSMCNSGYFVAVLQCRKVRR